MKRLVYLMLGGVAALVIASAAHDLSVSHRTWHDLDE